MNVCINTKRRYVWPCHGLGGCPHPLGHCSHLAYIRTYAHVMVLADVHSLWATAGTSPSTSSV